MHVQASSSLSTDVLPALHTSFNLSEDPDLSGVVMFLQASGSSPDDDPQTLMEMLPPGWLLMTS